MANNKQRHGKPSIGRCAQDKIGRELRAIYEPFVQEPLPDAFLGLLRSWKDAEAARYRLKQAVAVLREASKGFELNLAGPSGSALSVHAQQMLIAHAFRARKQSGPSMRASAGAGRHKERKVATVDPRSTAKAS